jgi:hypothetical protein
MPVPQPPHRAVIWRGHNCLPGELRFVHLVRSQCTETVRTRFALDSDKTMDLPLSAETLAELAQTLGWLQGKTTEKIPLRANEDETPTPGNLGELYT